MSVNPDELGMPIRWKPKLIDDQPMLVHDVGDVRICLVIDSDAGNHFRLSWHAGINGDRHNLPEVEHFALRVALAIDRAPVVPRD